MKKYIFLVSILVFQTMFGAETVSGKFIDSQVHTVEMDLEALTSRWHLFFQTHDWHSLVAGRTGLNVDCGLVYELPNFLNHSNEDLAIIDMTGISISEPHYHPCMTEIYFMLAGSGCVYVAGKKHELKNGDVLVIQPNKAHFTVPGEQCVIGCVCTPPFQPDHYIPLKESNAEVGFEYEHFKALCKMQ